MIPLTLELYDSNGLQYHPPFRKLRFAKTFYGGEDLWLTFVLDRSSHLDYPDVAYGNDIVLRDGLTPRFVGEMRQIEQDVETITCKALGNWIYLDDYGYGGQGKLWVDTRYGRWEVPTTALAAQHVQDMFEADNNERLYIGAKKGANYPNDRWGAMRYQCFYDKVKRIRFNYDFAEPQGTWEGRLWDLDNAALLWSIVATGAGAQDITLVNASDDLLFYLYSAAVNNNTAEDGTLYLMITDVELYGSTDIVITVSDVASDIVAQLQAGTPIENDTSLIDAITLQLEPLFYEEGESCHKALRDAASFGDQNNRAIGWGVEAGGYRVYVKQPDRNRVRYVVPPQYASRLSSRGQTDKGFVTEAWGKYIDEDGVERWTAKYYAHITATGIVANTTAMGDDLASNVYGVLRERVIDFGRVSATLAVQFLQQYLIEHAHPQIKSAFDIFGPVQDLDKGGAWIQPYELEMGYVVQVPHFRAVEAEGAVGVDLREFDTAFLLVGMRYDAEIGRAKLIPEGASEDLQRLIDYVREFERGHEEGLIQKRGEPSFRG